VSTPIPTAGAAVQLRTVPISAIIPIEGWNPRMAFDDAELQALSTSMLERGCLVPVLVQATGNGAYRLVDGEKRYEAAVLAALMELPAIVHAVDAGADNAALEGELLVDAVVANQLRSQLSPVEEALACRRLKSDHGLTLKGIAQKLQMTQAKVRERLAGWRLQRVLSDNGNEFRGRAFREVLERLEARHSRIHADRPQTNANVEALHKTILDERWRPAFARYIYPRYSGLRRELDTYLAFYNNDRVHHGRLTRGRIPADIVYGARKMKAR
jgi:ParB/RepB/Spo0J family partition protein